MPLEITMTETQESGAVVEVRGEGWTEVNGVTVLQNFVYSQRAYGAPGIELQMHCAVINGLPRCTGVMFRVAGDQAVEVPAGIPRNFKLEDMLEFAFSRAVSPSEGGPEVWAQMRESDLTMPTSAWSPVHGRALQATRAARRRGRTRYTDDFLRQVATVYNANVEQFPTRAVRVEFDVSETTAQTYVRKAREAGHITKTATKTGRPKGGTR